MDDTSTERLYHEILEQEIRLARSVAITARRIKPLSVWEVLMPIVFILGYMRSRQQREMFVQNFIFTKKLALEAAKDMRLEALSYDQVFECIEAKTKKLLETLEPNIYSEAIRQAHLAEIRLLILHYQRLFSTEKRRYAEGITAAYPTRKAYLAYLDNLRQAEKAVAAAAVKTVGDQADPDMVKRIETCAHQLRLKQADRFYSDEIRLEPRGRRMAALKKPRSITKHLQPLLENVLHGPGPKARPWRLLQVETSLACNLKCIMCPWQQIASERGAEAVMQPDIWRAVQDHLPRIQSIDFTGGGEPLLQPHLVQWVHDAHSAGCETGILTNALLLDEIKAKALIEAGISWICVSIDGANADTYNKIRRGSDFKRICRNVVALNRLRSGNQPKLMINFVLMKINIDQVEKMVSLAARLGVDQLNFKQCDVIRGKHGRGLGLFASKSDKATAQLEKRLKKACSRAAKHGIQTTAFRFTPNELPVCAQDPRHSMFVRFDGAVAPCINLAIGGSTTFLGQSVTMPQVRYGRLPGRDLAEIWEAKPCRFYRKLFEARNTAHEKIYIDGMLRATSNLERLEQNARDAMPKAPKGCRICHYLFDI